MHKRADSQTEAQYFYIADVLPPHLVLYTIITIGKNIIKKTADENCIIFFLSIKILDRQKEHSQDFPVRRLDNTLISEHPDHTTLYILE